MAPGKQNESVAYPKCKLEFKFLFNLLIWIDLNVNYIVSMALGIFGAINGGLTLQQTCLQH